MVKGNGLMEDIPIRAGWLFDSLVSHMPLIEIIMKISCGFIAVFW
jgi:hypothetical protein